MASSNSEQRKIRIIQLNKELEQNLIELNEKLKASSLSMMRNASLFKNSRRRYRPSKAA